MSSGAIMEFALSRDDSKHPLIEVWPPRPGLCRRARPQYRAPNRGATFHAIPLRGDATSPAQGLLLVERTGTRAR